MPGWLKKAVFYEIYPQSFNDTNSDGIGDIQGIIEKLDYIKNLGANAIWINPWYDSPFKDAGYDVRNYKMVAPRYGTNDDAKCLFEEAHKREMHIILDLVPGHTSEEHPWFIESGKALKKGEDGQLIKNEFSDRYIWTDFWISGMAGHPYVGGECDRNGTYMLNFFKCQPALNYGFADPKEPWQMSYLDEEPQKTLEAMMDVMRFWLDMGADGFRVDMAESLVKDDDEKKSCTCSLWRKVRKMLDVEYPEAAMVSEWSNPYLAINSAGFHMDFYLDHVGNGYNSLLRDYELYESNHVFGAENSKQDEKNEKEAELDQKLKESLEVLLNDEEIKPYLKELVPRSFERDDSFFRSDGDGNIDRFLSDYLPKYEATKGNGFISFMTCNHDTPRASRNLSESELRIAYATLLTLPGVPYIYYGDEIGMKYIEDMPTKEGGYTRTGSRTPMQWDGTINKGFSSAESDKLYLPVDENGPTVEEQNDRSDSLYNTVKSILKIRNEEESLNADADFEVIMSGVHLPFVYRRGELIIVVNPLDAAIIRTSKVYVDKSTGEQKEPENWKTLSELSLDKKQKLYEIGGLKVGDDFVKIEPQSFIIFK